MKLTIALLAGDGIGPEVIAQAVKVCDAVADKFNHEITWKPALTGAAAIDAVGDPYPDETRQPQPEPEQRRRPGSLRRAASTGLSGTLISKRLLTRKAFKKGAKPLYVSNSSGFSVSRTHRPWLD